MMLARCPKRLSPPLPFSLSLSLTHSLLLALSGQYSGPPSRLTSVSRFLWQFNPIEEFFSSVKSECRRYGTSILHSGNRAMAINSIIHANGRSGILPAFFQHAGWNTTEPTERGLELQLA